MATLTEKASQIAGDISNQSQFEAALQSAGASNLPAPAKGQLWDTVNKTRVGRGLPPLQVNPPAGTPPATVASAPATPPQSGAAPSAPASAPASPAPSRPSSGNAPAPPPAASGPAPLKQVPGQEVPLDQAPPAPTAKYEAPTLESATYKAPEYHAPNKGLEYAAMALALLFPGAPIGRAASSFVQGMNTGAQQRYQRDEQTAKDQYEAAKGKADTDNQGAIAAANAKFQNAEAYDRYMATKTAVGNDNQDRIFTARQNARRDGTNPDTGRPFQLPPALAKPPDPRKGYDALAQWHQARAAAYTALGATTPAAQEDAAAKEAMTAAEQARTQAAELDRTIMTINAANARTSAEIGAAAGRQEAEFRNGWAMLDARESQQYRDQATRVNGDANKLWANLTTPITDQYGQTKPPVVAPGSPLYQSLTVAMKGMQQGQGRMDPQGYAQYVIDNTPSLKDNPIAQQVLQAKAEGLEFTMRANGYQPVPFIPPPKLDSATILKHAGVNPSDPKVQAWRAQATSAGIDPDSPEALAAMKNDLKGGAGGAAPRPSAPVDPAHPDAPVLGVLKGAQGVLAQPGAKPDPVAMARAAGLTPGTPAWNTFMRTHGQ
jgi:hypothetical protein